MISAAPSACATLPFTYPHILTLPTRNSPLSMMIASLVSIIQLSLTFLHVPDEARINNHQALYLVSIGLIFVFCYLFKLLNLEINILLKAILYDFHCLCDLIRGRDIKIPFISQDLFFRRDF